MAEHQTPILIVGTDAEARIALEIADQLDVLVFGFLTEEPEEVSKEINDILVVAELGKKDADTLLNDANVKVVIAATKPQDRRDLAEALKGTKPEVITFVHPTSTVSQHARLEKGCLVNAHTSIAPNVLIGEHTYLGAHVSIDVDTEIGDYCTINDGVRIGRGCFVEEEAYLGHGAVIFPGVKVGHKAMVAAGAVVLQDVPEEASVVGNPAQAV